MRITKKSKIFIAGHNGMVGSAIKKKFEEKGYKKLLTISKKKLNLIDQKKVLHFLKKSKPDLVIIAAAKVGGILKNSTAPAEFLYENIMIQNNIIHSCYINNITKVLFLGSSCIYPRHSNQPIKESELLKGSLEETNEAYAIAKIAGIKMCHFYNLQYGTKYKSLMPTNLYGRGDNYHPEDSHVIPGLIQRFHKAKINNKLEIKVWGNGKALREFLYVNDLAKASLLVGLNKSKEIDKIFLNSNSFINVGFGKEISIYDLSLKIAEIVEYKGKITFDSSKPDGTPRKILDSTLINSLGWKPETSLNNGLVETYNFFKQEIK